MRRQALLLLWLSLAVIVAAGTAASSRFNKNFDERKLDKVSARWHAAPVSGNLVGVRKQRLSKSATSSWSWASADSQPR
jgi:hypothetical protein